MGVTLERTPLHKQLAAKAMLDAGYSGRETADECELSRSSVSLIQRKFKPDATDLAPYKKALPLAFYAHSNAALLHISPRKLEESSALQLMTIAGIAVDKARSMEGLDRQQFNIVNVVQDCRNVATRVSGELQHLQSLRLAKASTQSECSTNQHVSSEQTVSVSATDDEPAS